MKTGAFEKLGWKQEWIDEAEDCFRRVYRDSFTPTDERIGTPDTVEDQYPHDYLDAIFGSQTAENFPLRSEIDTYLESP